MKQRILDNLMGFVLAAALAIVVFVLVFLLSGCASPTLAAYCKQAARAGWCTAECGRRQPPDCKIWRSHPVTAPGSRRR